MTSNTSLLEVFSRAYAITHHVTYHVRPHQPIIDQQGLGRRGLVHKEAHPVIRDLTIVNMCAELGMCGFTRSEDIRAQFKMGHVTLTSPI